MSEQGAEAEDAGGAASEKGAGAVASMTGFAAVRGEHPPAVGAGAGETAAVTFAWEARSVNARALDLKIRLPSGFERLEPEIRRRAAARLARGSVTLALTIDRPAAAGGFRVNRAQLDVYLAVIEELRRVHRLDAPRADGVLALKGVIEPAEDSPGAAEGLEDALLAALDALLERLVATRREEGARLAGVLARELDEIAALVVAIRRAARETPDRLRERVERQLEDLLAGQAVAPAPDRLAQEVALLATKADVTEELERLDAHVAAARALLAEGTAVGRRLDFLAQEFNREANTICSKAAETEITRAGLALKAAIERLREQIQNIE